MAGLFVDPALRPRDRNRRERWRRERWRRRAPLAASALLHLGFLLLVVLAVLTREKPPEPLPPPAYAVYYESGAPDRPSEPEPESQAERTAPPPEPPAVAAPPAPPPLPDQPVPEEPRPPTAPPQLAEPAPPPPLPPPALPQAVPPPAPPRPNPQVAVVPPRPEPTPLPLPPPPPAPPRDAPRVEPVPTPAPQRLPGIYMPEALALSRPQPPRPTPSRPEAPRRRLDLALGPLPPPGRFSVEPETDVRGAKVGPDWRNAFRRWLDENKRYPENARVVGDQGTNRVELQVTPDGRVRSARLVRQSGSVWLDAGTLSLFRGANLPPFPPGADPAGVTVDLTIHYILIR
jgi:TonB family protein